MPRRVPPLNASKLASLSPLPRKDHYDGACPGLHLRVTVNGSRSWRYKYWNPDLGKQERVTIGSYPEIGLRQARDAVASLRVDVVAGTSPAKERRERKAVLPFDEAVSRYLAHLESIGKPSSEERPLPALPADGGLEADRARPNRPAHGRRAGRCDRPGSHPRTGNAILTSLRSFFAWCTDRAGLLRENPIAGMRPLFRTAARERVLTPEEISRSGQATAAGADRLQPRHRAPC